MPIHLLCCGYPRSRVLSLLLQISDFGIARLVAGKARSSDGSTTPAAMEGQEASALSTAMYCAPEVLQVGQVPQWCDAQLPPTVQLP